MSLQHTGDKGNKQFPPVLNFAVVSHDDQTETFTVTEISQNWHRFTISVKYTDAPTGSLEAELSSIQSEYGRFLRLYNAIHKHLRKIDIRHAITNLRLETDNDKLHIYSEDRNEEISYPPISAVKHLGCVLYKESSLAYVSHISSFVYTVKLNDEIVVKKDIVNSSTVEELLYEINALCTLQCSKAQGKEHVIEFIGVVVDNESAHIKGLLTRFATGGNLRNILRYEEASQISVSRRKKWMEQIIQGLSSIHESGFIHGDLTLENIMLDSSDNVKIININRHRCREGWVPPELKKMEHSKDQLFYMFIGSKSDLYQCGLVLFAVAERCSEPEKLEFGVDLEEIDDDVPEYLWDIIKTCLETDPSRRQSAKVLTGDIIRHYIMDQY